METWRNTNASTCVMTTPGHMTDSTLGCRMCLSNDASVCVCVCVCVCVLVGKTDYFWSSLYYHFLWREIKTLWRLCFSLTRVRAVCLMCVSDLQDDGLPLCWVCTTTYLQQQEHLAQSRYTTMHAQKHWDAVT